MRPVPGDEFVWMEESPGAYGETMERIVEVLEEVVPGVWLIGYRDGPVLPIVRDFFVSIGKYTPKLEQTHRMLCRVTKGEDGRWHAVRPIVDEDLDE